MTLDQDNRDSGHTRLRVKLDTTCILDTSLYVQFNYTRTEYDEGAVKPNSDNYEAVVGHITGSYQSSDR